MISITTSQSIIKKQVELLCNKFLNDYAYGGHKYKSIIKKCQNNYFSTSLGIDYTITSALSRSIDSSLGNMIQYIALELAQEHGFKIISDETKKKPLVCDICGTISKETEMYISQISNNIEKIGIENLNIDEIKANLLDRIATNPGHPIKIRTDLALSKVTLNGQTKIFLFELKMGGDLDKGKANKTREESLKIYAVTCSKYLNGILNGDTSIDFYFATAYNKDDLKGGYETWKSASIKSLFDNSELLINKDFWNFIFNDGNGFEFFYSTYINEMRKYKNTIEKIGKDINKLLTVNGEILCQIVN